MTDCLSHKRSCLNRDKISCLVSHLFVPEKTVYTYNDTVIRQAGQPTHLLMICSIPSSLLNDILSDSLQPLSDDDLRPMSEAIENMDTMNMNLKNRKEAKQAAEKIQAVFSKYNQKLLYEKSRPV